MDDVGVIRGAGTAVTGERAPPSMSSSPIDPSAATFAGSWFFEAILLSSRIAEDGEEAASASEGGSDRLANVLIAAFAAAAAGFAFLALYLTRPGS